MRNLILAVIFLSPAMLCASDDGDSDALEPLNRAIFSLNDSLDQMIAEPMARAY